MWEKEAKEGGQGEGKKQRDNRERQQREREECEKQDMRGGRRKGRLERTTEGEVERNVDRVRD